MGASTDAKLFLGVHFDEGEHPWAELEDNEDWDGEYEAWLRQLYGGPQAPDVPFEGNADEYSQYWADCRGFDKTLPVEIVYHCSGDYEMYGVAIKGTPITANRGYPQEITALPPATAEQGDTLEDFCTKAGIDMPETGIGWWLVSYGG